MNLKNINIDPVYSYSPGVAVAPEVLDLEHLSRYTMGDQALEAELLMLFRNQYEQQIILLNETDDAGDWRIALHTLKGAARAVGAWQLGKQAEDLEFSPMPPRGERTGVTETLAEAGKRCMETITLILAD